MRGGFSPRLLSPGPRLPAMKSTITPLEEWTRRKLGLKAGQPVTREELRDWWLLRLRQTLAWARERSPFYRWRLRGLPEDPLAQVEDLARLPFTTAEDLRREHRGMLCTSQGQVARIVTLRSSGTTAEPKRLYFSQEDLELTLDFFHHGMSTLTGPGRTVLILLPGSTPDSVGDLLARALGRLGARGVVHGPVKDPARTLEVMAREEVACLVGVPSQVLALARHPKGAELRPGQVQSVLLTTDYLPRAIRRTVGAAWGCRVFNHYGMTELGLGGAVECLAQDGCHLRSADLFCEVVDPRGGEPLPPGRLGELVFTTLTRRAMPLIRYRSGDLGRLREGPCACGSWLPRIDDLRGRVAGVTMLAPGLNLSLADLDEVVFATAGVLDFRARLTRRGGAWSLGLCLRTTAEAGPECAVTVRAALERKPVIQQARQQGALVLEPVGLGGADWFGEGVAKRTILVTQG